MSRLKLLGAVALLGVLACEEATPPPPVGSIMGQVAIEGTGIDGVSVNLSNGNSTTTSGGGNYRFDNVEGGAYTVTISGYPSDATFDATSAAATISSAGQSVTVNFSGAYIRTASVMGTVTVENMGLGGVTVALSGMSSATATTDDNGQYAFTGLRMGSYSVEISGFDSDEIGFSNTASAVTVGVGESKIVSFDGTYLRTAGIQGRVSVEGEGLEGVTVSLSGGPDGVDETAATDAAGQYSFARLRAGDYQVGISGYDTDDYEFEVTSQNVTVALGETANVPFEGVLLRTSGISGRVSVEGMGLEGIAVTLSMADADDMMAMTDAGGLYAFSGLAAGAYTVAIAVEGDAYVFESMSMDVMVGDDETAIVNFEGMHARTASVSGQLFIDELLKNDTMDEGEAPLPAAGVPVVLVGPGVNDQMPGATDEMGQFAFMGLRAGAYQLVVTITPEVAMALGDFAFGGSPTGYAVELGVGDTHMQNLPFDITHTTVNFSVMLKSGDMTGAALEGATVNLYADAGGETRAGSGMTDEMGMAAIRVARAGTTGNMVYASVDAGDAYTVDADAGMQTVMWDPQMTMTAASNDADIVNMNVDVTVSGATITTDYGGGKALAGWAISVMSGEEAVEGAPEALDDDGMAAFMTTVDAVPATFTFAVADDQDNSMDGGENYEGTEVEYTHDGLSLAGTMDAGMIEVGYTTQTLKVYVHHERDQVMGYTGNILGGDVRDPNGSVTVDIRYIDDSGRSRAFAAAADVGRSSADGAHTFSNVPADANVIVQAALAADAAGVMLLDPDELAAYTGMDANGITGGAFGDMGGFNHTVELCPLMATDPTGQRHGECASFAYVSTHTVSGMVWKKTVKTMGTDFEMVDTDFVAGVTVGLMPVEGQNLVGEDQSYTTAEEDDDDTALDETHQFSFGDIAAGVYNLSVPGGWQVKMGGQGATDDVGNALNPLAGDVALDVTPATGTVYGRVVDKDGFPLPDATVTANGVSATTDPEGRYIIDGFGAETRTISGTTHSNSIFVEASVEDVGKDSDIIGFAANEPTMVADLQLKAADATASVSGTVRASGSNAPVAGAEILVGGDAPNNATDGKLLTGADGTYTAIFDAMPLGSTVTVSVSKAGMTFVPASIDAPAHAGSAITGIDFTGFMHATISGRVAAPGGGPLSGVAVTATSTADATMTYSDTTGTTGLFRVSVPFGSYTLAAARDNFTFEIPAAYQTVSVAPGQNVPIGTIQARTFAADGVAAARVTDTTTEGVTTYTGDVRVTWNAGTVPTGHVVTYQAQTRVGTGDWTNLGTAVSSDALAAEPPTDSTVTTAAAPGDGLFMVRVQAVSDNGTAGDAADDATINSDAVDVAAIDPSAGSVAAARVLGGTDPDTLNVSWDATTNTNSDFRVVVRVKASALGDVDVWFVANEGDSNSRSWTFTIENATWTSVDGTAVALTVADFDKELMVAVESVQGTVSADNPWKRSAVVTVDAKPSG